MKLASEDRSLAIETGRRIRFRRRTEDIGGQDRLAELIGCAQSQVSEWEKGHHLPREPRLGQLAKALNCSRFYLLTGCELPGDGRDLDEIPAFAARLVRDFLHACASALGESVDDVWKLQARVRERRAALSCLIEPCMIAV